MKKEYTEKNFLDKEYFDFIKNYFLNHDVVNKPDYDFYGSRRVDTFNDEVLNKLHIDLLERAKKLFNSETLLPTYAVFSEYSGEQAYLDRHLDAGPCTYTIDLMIYQKTPWSIFVEDTEYFLDENEALIFYPNEQYHWRGDFPDSENNKVAIILFSYVEPDHLWWTIPEKMRPMLRNNLKPYRSENQ